MHCFTLSNAFVLQTPDAACSVSRVDASVSPCPRLCEEGAPAPLNCDLLGLLRLQACSALIIATDSPIAVPACFGEVPLRRVAAPRVLLCGEPSSVDKRYLELLHVELALPSLYFANGVDATRLVSQQCDSPDSPFCWNSWLAAPFAAAGLLHLVALTFRGFAGHTAFTVAGSSVRVLLLGRRHCRRPGRRFWARGLQEDGSVANCVATEQICKVEHRWAAHLSVRGSAPVFWAQPPDLSPKPRLLVRPVEDSAQSFMAHFASISSYTAGPVTVLSLLKLSPSHPEAELADAYRAAYTAAGLPHDSFIAFDFQAEGGAGARGQAALLHAVSPALNAAGLHLVENGVVLHRQRGVLRTNCLDNLDRSNMAQHTIAGMMLAAQLHALKLAAFEAPLPPLAASALRVSVGGPW